MYICIYRELSIATFDYQRACCHLRDSHSKRLSFSGGAGLFTNIRPSRPPMTLGRGRSMKQKDVGYLGHFALKRKRGRWKKNSFRDTIRIHRIGTY